MKILKIAFRTLLYFFLTVVILFVLWMVFPPATAVISGVLSWAVYHKAGTVILHYREKKVTVPVYKSSGRPFLLVGPHKFYSEEDFLFIRPESVIATATDGGCYWIRLFGLLFLHDDLTDRHDCVRMPFWDLLENKDPRVGVRRIADFREYVVLVGGEDKQELRFRIPENLITQDMSFPGGSL